MAHRCVIVVQKAGEAINPAYLDRVVKEYASYTGMATVSDGKLITAIVDGAPSKEQVSKLAEEFKGSIVFVFGKVEPKVKLLPEDRQPFEVLKDKDGNVMAIAALDGGFEGYSVAKSSHTDEWHCVEEFLKPKMEKILKYSNSGVDGVMAELDDPITRKDISNSWVNRGNIVILTTKGDPVLFRSNNVQYGQYNWGYTTHSLGYFEQTVPKADPAPEPAKNDLFAQMKARLSGKPAPATVEQAVEPLKTETKLIQEDLEWVGPAPTSMTNAQKRNWWIAEIGYCPDAYKKGSCKVQRVKGTKKGVLAALANERQVQDAGSPISNEEIKAEAAAKLNAEQPVVKDTSVKNIAMSMDVMPILSPKQKLKVITEWKKSGEIEKILGDDMKKVPDPKLLKSFEEDYPQFTDDASIKSLDNLMGLTFEQLLQLGLVEVKALAQLTFNLRNEWYKTKLQLQSVLSNPNNKIAEPQRLAI